MGKSKIFGEESKTVPSSPLKINNNSSHELNKKSPGLMKQYKSIGRFQEIQKDEAVFKRVLIKNGLYPKDK